jgi:hypothetical protein
MAAFLSAGVINVGGSLKSVEKRYSNDQVGPLIGDGWVQYSSVVASGSPPAEPGVYLGSINPVFKERLMQNLWVKLPQESPNLWVIFFQNIGFPKVHPLEIQ